MPSLVSYWLPWYADNSDNKTSCIFTFILDKGNVDQHSEITVSHFLCSLASPSPIHSTKSESTVTPSEEKAGYAIIHTEETESKTGSLLKMLHSSHYYWVLIASQTCWEVPQRLK